MMDNHYFPYVDNVWLDMLSVMIIDIVILELNYKTAQQQLLVISVFNVAKVIMNNKVTATKYFFQIAYRFEKDQEAIYSNANSVSKAMF